MQLTTAAMEGETKVYHLLFTLVPISMTTYGVTESPETVDYSSNCCCQTTDGIYYYVPKEYFRLNQILARRKLLLTEPFPVPLSQKAMEHFLPLLERATLLSVQAVEGETLGENNERPEWMRELDKRQRKFVDGCLGITSWEGKEIPFYENPLPQINDVVWIRFTQIGETSATVQLLEYGKREGIIPYTEITRRRVRSMGKLVKVGRMEPAQVIRIDTGKGYIDLSKKQVTPNEAKACEAHYHKGNDVRSIVCHVADECGISPREAMEKIAYPLYRREPGKHAWNWLNELNQTQNVEGILGPLGLEQNVIDKLMLTLKNAMRVKVVTLAAEMELTCFGYDGVEAIRDVLLVGKNFGEGRTPEISLSVNIIGPPKYGLRARTDMKDEGIALMAEALEAMKVEITKRGGQLKVTSPPQAVGDNDHPERPADGDEDEEDAE